MSGPPLLELRQAVVTHLKADTVLTALIPAASLYGERVEADHGWPYGRYGEDDAIPGHEIAFPYHIYSKAGYTDECKAIIQEVGTSLDGVTLLLESGQKAHIALAGTRVIPDPDEADAWHGIASFRANVARDCEDR